MKHIFDHDNDIKYKYSYRHHAENGSVDNK